MSRRHYKWLGLGAGFGLGMLDLALIDAMGIRMTVGDAVVTRWVMMGAAITFGALGFVIGRLAETLGALDASQRKVLRYEKLAAIGRMAAGVAHEVRNPLGVIRASAEHIAEELGPEGGAGRERSGDAQRACRFITEEVDRLDGFVGDLMDFTRPLTAEPVATSARALAERARALAEGHLGADHALELHVADGLMVHADEDLAVRVLLGLLVNAAQATGDGGRIELRAGETEGGSWFEVGDDGPGVAPADRERVFEPFFTRRARGTGLGLAMGAKIAEAHGGTLALTESDRGACFRLLLPGAEARRRAA